MDAQETKEQGNGYTERNYTERKCSGGGGGGSEVALRVAAMVLTVTAAIIAGLDKQTKTVSVTITDGFYLNFPHATAKFTYLSALIYLVVANSVASAFAALSLWLSLGRLRGNAHSTLLKATIDVTMVALLFSAIGAGGAVGLLGYKGNSHVMWNRVCSHFGRFCDVALASLLLSLVGSVVFLLLVLLAFHNLSRKLQQG